MPPSTSTSSSFDSPAKTEPLEIADQLANITLNGEHKKSANAESETGASSESGDAEDFVVYKSKATKKQESRLAKEATLLEKAALTSTTESAPALDQPAVKEDEIEAKTRQDLPGEQMIEVYVNGKDHADNKAIREKVPLFALTAVSRYANTHFHSNPSATSIHFLNCDKRAVGKIVRALERNPTGFKVPRADDFIDGLKLYQASKAMDINDENCTKSLLVYLRNYISHHLLDYAEIDGLLSHVAVDDLLFKHLAHNLAHLRFTKRIPDPEPFTAYLESCPTLKIAMQVVDDEKFAPRKAKEQPSQHLGNSTAVRPQKPSPNSAKVKQLAKTDEKSEGAKVGDDEAASAVKATEPAKHKGDRFDAAFNRAMNTPVVFKKN
ncbi:hypothetical protein K491DRAFT_679125 [Lophiostoma macrostomum CBS 122681]|uniref:Uncharacterized protein n=1 Tax=Lophiostoma macrostomum CBS 122681 TaxID=1314788 RepID=A0A6A6T568_9PLEO|nr:hypothetical protein K491DRAFT_679125 [Lophiostoma macrostomum CBS 122681]